MAGLLSRAGFTIVSSSEIADIIIYNTCGVKETTKNKVLFEIKKGCKAYKSKIVITGCLPEIDLNSISHDELEGEGFIAKEAIYLEGKSLITGKSILEISFFPSKVWGSKRERAESK